jgi:hypothetical protein
MLKQYLISLHLLLAILSGGPTLASVPPIYDVEVIVFLNNGAVDHGEQWIPPRRDDRFNGVFPEGEFTELGKAFYTLKDVSYTLESSRGYSVLFHRAWRQLAYDRNEAVAYPVHSIIENGRNSVEGTVKLMLERYLHLDMDLLLMSSNGNPNVLYSDAPGNVPVFELREKRRIKSTELHYFDHPRFGAIARVTPYIPPNTEEKTIEINGTATEESISVTNPAADDDQLTR